MSSNLGGMNSGVSNFGSKRICSYNRCAITSELLRKEASIEVFKKINDEIEDIKRRVAELEAAQLKNSFLLR